MMGGFGLLAFPAEYGNSGITTFLVNQDGKVFQKDLGPNTTQLARKIESFHSGSNVDQNRCCAVMRARACHTDRSVRLLGALAGNAGSEPRDAPTWTQLSNIARVPNSLILVAPCCPPRDTRDANGRQGAANCGLGT